jgi:glycosyltransferase involved in cell wall biosynthesis
MIAHNVDASAAALLSRGATERTEGGKRIQAPGKTSQPGLPLVTVVTVVFNRVRYVEETIKAVLSQRYPNVEYIIIDGGSTDGTREIIERYDDRIDYWLSEPDAGLYHAMNKALAIVDDDDSYVIFSHSDDSLFSPDALAEAIRLGSESDFIYGRILVTDPETEKIIGRELSLANLALETVPHPATLVRRRVFDEVGMFDTRYSIAADYDFIVRCFQAGVSRRFVDVTVARTRMWGLSEEKFLLSCTERKDVVRRHFTGKDRLAGVLHVNLYDIPRNMLRSLLDRLGMLQYWRKLKRV